LSSLYKPLLILAVLVPAAGAGLAQTPSAEEAGRLRFNSDCGSCHGDDAVQNERRLDLRRLTARYPETAGQVFDETVKKGRPDQGMPSWDGAFSTDELAAIKAFVFARQAPAAP
jgi:mono/diheme cytochrome c family protein